MDKITTIKDMTIYRLLALFFIIIGVYFRVDPLTLLTVIQGAIIMFVLLTYNFINQQLINQEKQ